MADVALVRPPGRPGPHGNTRCSANAQQGWRAGVLWRHFLLSPGSGSGGCAREGAWLPVRFELCG